MIRDNDTRAERYDAIVVGARVAGAATAMLLARSGLKVLMVDRRRPGSDTLSTHALMRGGVLQLHRWNLLERVRRTGATPVTRTTFHYGDTTEAIDIKPGGGVDAMYAPRRHVLDSLLVEAAVEAGVEMRFGVTVQDLSRDPNGRVTGVVARTSAGSPVRATAPVTIGADGVRSLVARRTGAPIEQQGGSAGSIIYSYWTGPIADGYDWFYRPGVSAGLIPTNDGATCVWVGAPAARFEVELRRNLEGSFERLLREAAPEAVERIEAAGKRESRYYGFPGIASYMRRTHGPGWALVGDASHFKDPLSAHGITDALRDAELLANAIVATGAGAPTAAAMTDYAHERDRLSKPLHDATDALASYRWDLAEVRELLLDLARAMKAEVEMLMNLPLDAVKDAA